MTEHLEFNESSSLTYYNIACAYTLSNDYSNAFLYLEKSIKNGYANEALFLSDQDLQPLRGTNAYINLYQKYFCRNKIVSQKDWFQVYCNSFPKLNTSLKIDKNKLKAGLPDYEKKMSPIFQPFVAENIENQGNTYFISCVQKTHDYFVALYTFISKDCTEIEHYKLISYNDKGEQLDDLTLAHNLKLGDDITFHQEGDITPKGEIRINIFEESVPHTQHQKRKITKTYTINEQGFFIPVVSSFENQLSIYLSQKLARFY